MINNNTGPAQPLSAKMVALLKESYQRELESRPPLGIYYTQSAKGLYKRGFFSTKEHNIDGKVYTRFHLTEDGRNYLRDLTHQANSKASKSKYKTEK